MASYSSNSRGMAARRFLGYIVAVALIWTVLAANRFHGWWPYLSAAEKLHRAQVLEQCKYIATPAGPPPDFHERTESDRFVSGTKPVLIRNAKIWTAEANGTEVIYGDVLLDKGLIKDIGYISSTQLQELDVEIYDAHGSWVTPGIVDLHSHIGVYSAPALAGAQDGNSFKAPILPWLRSIDAINTHDDSYELARSGGVTTAQILPGSADNIGGQAYVIKLRDTEERSPTSMAIEPPYSLNGSHFDHSLTPRWRHMKHACGENPSSSYSQTRMDSVWAFRQAYDQARKIKDAQDQYCANAEAGLWKDIGAFPDSLQWESLVDVLRGKVKLAVHCYEAVDLDAIVRLTHEFQFPVASFHHAGETYLVPDLLKQTWGGAPSIALFATNFRKKREAYRGSEFAPRVLSDHGIPVVMKSDHPVVNSRYLLNEASMAYFYGLEDSLALSSVTSTPAKALGLGHRIGTIRKGYDADIVVWDSHPLALGSTPKQVFIDGIAQLKDPFISEKPESYQTLPQIPNFDHEAFETVKYEGLPPLAPKRAKSALFTNVRSLHTRENDEIVLRFDHGDLIDSWSTVLVEDGLVVCSGPQSACVSYMQNNTAIIDLKGGSILPGFTTFGSPLGLVEIRLEPSTNDGPVLDPLTNDIPPLLENTLISAVDGLQFEGRNTLLAYRGGVTRGIVAPVGRGFIRGISTAFSLGATHALDGGAIQSEHVALHVGISLDGAVSVSTQIAYLRKLLLEGHHHRIVSGESAELVGNVLQGKSTLVIEVQNADIMATLLLLKKECEEKTRRRLRMTFSGATEAHLLAEEISAAGVSVIVTSPKPFPEDWERRRILAGPPLTEQSSVMALLSAGVNVAIGVVDEYAARNTRFELAWASMESNGQIDKTAALALATTNLEKALGLEIASYDLVAYEGGDVFDMSSKVVASISSTLGRTDMFM